MDLIRGKLAVLTGGGSGIGRELVVQLAAAGCSVATCDVSEPALAETAARALAGAPAGTRVSTHACDVSDEASVGRFRDEVLERHATDRVDLLFNNAGIAGVGSFVVDDRAEWERVFDVCWGGVYRCTRAFLPLLCASERAWLVNTSSVNGFWATNGPGIPSTAYSAAKFAVKGFSEALIEDLRLHAPHVHVAVVMPGFVSTPIALNSARVIGGGRLDAVRAMLVKLGLPVANAGDDELPRIVAALDELDEDLAPTSAPAAARAILDGLRAGHWRILVGDDAHRIDAAVRADPDAAYDPGFTGLERGWFRPMLLLRALFDPRADRGLAASYELRDGEDRIAVRIAGGQLAIARRLAAAPDATLDVAPHALVALLAGERTLDEAVRRGELTLAGDRAAVERLLAVVAPPRRDGGAS